MSMFRTALRGSARAAGALSASSRIASIEGSSMASLHDLDTSPRRVRSFWEAVATSRRHPRRFQGQRANATASPLQQRTTPAIVNTISRSYAADAKASPTEVSSILEQRIRGVQEEAGLAETGRVLSVG
ncbi:Alpha subunit of the F1 sector of mitochondrial F1F0 ATP synthase [Teratosphaeriaceae sp. CCFEE 6253]|nr:Alpha subunit of the F1 sector of mitochondrial F1F0 ATP synthase [Teratosphaeriaceae sp. CCFEE 6253]